MQKLYCYVDETGQDLASEVFIVVAVVSSQDQNFLRKELYDAELTAKTGQRKWHKSKPERRLKYLNLVLQKKIGAGELYFGKYQKPLPYFLPLIETLEKGIADRGFNNYRAVIHIDGIDKKKAAELTNALRLRNVKLELVRSRRDESEPLIRLADMWAGCIRSALLGDEESEAILSRARNSHYLTELTK